jgi:pimeloyl-ACP methyl ester carboxylesterase
MIPAIVVALVLAFLLVAGAAYQFAGARRSARRYPPPGTLIDADGQPLHVVCAGSGRPTALFESGIAASSLSWTRVLPDVAGFTHACAYDRAGLGWSEPARTPRTLARLVAELHGVLAHSATAGSAVLVGHSFGALLVCVYTRAYPGDVAGLVLLDPPSEWHEMTRRQARLLWGGIQLSRIGGFLARVGVVRACLALLTSGAPGVPRNVVRMFGPTTARTVERLVGEVRKLPAEVHPVVQAHWCQPKCFRAMAEHLAALDEITAAASRVGSLGDVPLVIVSSHDQPPEIVSKHRELARLSSQGRHMIATRSGHWIQFDEPNLVVTVVREIVERVRKAGIYS